ncbi:hypothetical protein SA3733_05905, partial [Aggregatibacter actinomycetemcomitans serotype d str. SA3733]
AKDTPPKRLSYLDNKIHEINVAMAELERDYQLGETVDDAFKAKLEKQLTELVEEKALLSTRFEQQKTLVGSILAFREKMADTETKYSEEERQAFIRELQEKKAEYEAIKPEDCLIHAEVGSKQITAVIADLTGIPVNSMTGDELTKLTELPGILNDSIKGQSQAIEQIHKNLLTRWRIYVARAHHLARYCLWVQVVWVKQKLRFKSLNIFLAENNSSPPLTCRNIKKNIPYHA